MLSVYEISDDGGLRPTDLASFPPSGEPDRMLRWLRMIDPQPDEWQTALSMLNLSEGTQEPLHQDGLSSQVETDGNGLAMKLPVIDPQGERAVTLRAACSPTTLITVEELALPVIDRVVTERSDTPDSKLSLIALFVEVIDAAVGSAGAAYLKLRRELEDLADLVEGEPQEVSPDDLLAIRSKLSRLTMMWDDQIHGFMELKRCHSIIVAGEHAHDLLRDLISEASRGLQLLAHMESRLRDLRQHQQQSSQESTNRRLNMLAILSSIYMPATLIAGLYGMNFEFIPVTTLHYGYFIVMGFMAAVVLGHFWYFYRRGWFK